MKRHVVILLAIMTALAAAIPSGAATPPRPFGSFDGGVTSDNSGSGIFSLVGWALASDGIAAVDILVDGTVDGRAAYGRSRPGVTARFPGFPDSAHPGWVYGLDTTHYLNGQHSIVARVRTKGGQTLDLTHRSFEFLNAPQNLLPFGKIEFPNKDAELFGTCGIVRDTDLATLRDDGQISLRVPRRFNLVTGYVVDPGAADEVDGDGVGYVELLVDGAVLYNTVTDCFFSKLTGGLTNCYGVFRPDIGTTYPTLHDSVHGGFRFVLDLSQLLAPPALGLPGLYNPGHHTLTIRAGDLSGTTVNIATMPVTFSCDDFIGNDASFGIVDIPPNGLTFGGSIFLTGWALDFQGVAAVKILIDGQLYGLAALGQLRPGVSSLYPGFPQSLAPGWILGFDTTKFSNGVHRVQAVAVDTLGIETTIGEQSFTIGNPHQ